MSEAVTPSQDRRASRDVQGVPASKKKSVSQASLRSEEAPPVSADPAADNMPQEQLIRKGKFIFADGSQYVGQYQLINGKKRRTGLGVFSCGLDEYIGAWEEDAMHGQGEYKFSSGAVFKGQFQKNRFYGEGIYRWPDGAVYEGSWRDSKMHGQGCYTNKEGVHWKGLFFNGRYNTGKAYISLR